MSAREFKVLWDGKVYGVGRLETGFPPGSPLFPVLFLVWLALKLKEIKRHIVEKMPSVVVEFPSYDDDLHCGLYD